MKSVNVASRGFIKIQIEHLKTKTNKQLKKQIFYHLAKAFGFKHPCLIGDVFVPF